MLSNIAIHATLPAQDLARAKQFYAEKLGLTPVAESPAALDYECGGTLFSLFPSQGRSSGEFTQAGWRTDDIEALVKDLKSRGLTFVEYDQPDFKTVNSIATLGSVRAAWFKDSEGNLLGLAQLD